MDTPAVNYTLLGSYPYERHWAGGSLLLDSKTALELFQACFFCDLCQSGKSVAELLFSLPQLGGLPKGYLCIQSRDLDLSGRLQSSLWAWGQGQVDILHWHC